MGDLTMVITARFDPGKLVATPAVMEVVDPDYAMGALSQHVQGKWGVVDQNDWKANDEALKHGGRLLSVYPLPNESDNFWIITEAADETGHRSTTTILLPSDY
jgi:hypothetical protein